MHHQFKIQNSKSKIALGAGQSRADFVSKISIASKEARETNYWLRLLRDSKILDEAEVKSLLSESDAIIKILTSIVKSTNESNSKPKIQNCPNVTAIVKSTNQNNSKSKIQNPELP